MNPSLNHLLPTMADLMEEAAGVIAGVPQKVFDKLEVRHHLVDELEGSALMLREPAPGAGPSVIKKDNKYVIDWPEILQLSHSRLKVWRRCQMQHHYRYYQGLRKIKPPIPLFVGSGIHTMIEAQIERGDWAPERAAFKKEFEKLFREEREELGDLPSVIGAIVEGYFERYRNDGLTYVKRHRGVSSEIRVLVDLDVRTRFLGLIDAFPQDSEGRNWVMDHKSCKTIPDEESRFADLQLLMYVWLLPQLGYPRPDGVIWDYIRKKPPAVPEVLKNGTISKAAKIDTTYEVYMGTVHRVLGVDALPQYEDFAAALKGREEKFYRRIYLPSPNSRMVDNVVKDVIATGEEIRMLGPNATARNMSRDCKTCSYYSLCQAEVRGLDSDYIRKTEYTVKESHASIEKEADPAVDSDD